MEPNYYHPETGYETYYDGDGRSLGGLGADISPVPQQTAAAPSSSTLPSWLQDIIGAGSQIATTAAQVSAAKQIAKTGQVPTAQVNVGVAPDTKKALYIGGGIALGLIGLMIVMKKK